MSTIRPQEGFQQSFLSSKADIVIGGGAAFGGKTFALLLEPLYHINNPKFGATIFRRTFPQIKNEGALWDTSSFYSNIGGKPNQSDLKWKFPAGSSVKFQHLEFDKNVYDHQGAQYPFIGFDELTHFSEFQFFYLLSRNRSTCGVKPYVRATCNPDPDSWVARFISYWIEQDEQSPDFGFPIMDRCGKLRYMVRENGNIVWGDSKEEVIEKVPSIVEAAALAKVDPLAMVKSVTFIPGRIYENKIGMGVNPEYVGNLMSQDEQTKSQLLDGNWKTKVDPTSLFDPQHVRDLFTNYQSAATGKYITCDPSRFGKDLTVIFVWNGWQVVEIQVYYKTESIDIVNHIEALRQKHGVTKSNVVVDQDGVGGGTVALGGYVGFSSGAAPIIDPATKQKENYENLKTQCFYRVANRVNGGEVSITISSENVIINGNRSLQLKYMGEVCDIRDVIRKHLSAIKRRSPDPEKKYRINSKDEQKVLLDGASPDFADVTMLREWFELKPSTVQYISRRFKYSK